MKFKKSSVLIVKKNKNSSKKKLKQKSCVEKTKLNKKNETSRRIYISFNDCTKEKSLAKLVTCLSIKLI